MSVAILRQGDVLIASIRGDLSDSQLLALRDDLADRVGAERIRGVVLDVGALDVIDSFVARSLRSIVHSVRLRGTETVVTGIRPDVARVSRSPPAVGVQGRATEPPVISNPTRPSSGASGRPPEDHGRVLVALGAS